MEDDELNVTKDNNLALWENLVSLWYESDYVGILSYKDDIYVVARKTNSPVYFVKQGAREGIGSGRITIPDSAVAYSVGRVVNGIEKSWDDTAVFISFTDGTYLQISVENYCRIPADINVSFGGVR